MLVLAALDSASSFQSRWAVSAGRWSSAWLLCSLVLGSSDPVHPPHPLTPFSISSIQGLLWSARGPLFALPLVESWDSCRAALCSLPSGTQFCAFCCSVSEHSCFMYFVEFSISLQWEDKLCFNYSIMTWSRNESLHLENMNCLKRSSNCCG